MPKAKVVEDDDEHFDVPPLSEQLAAVAMGEGTMRERAAVRPISLRLSPTILGRVDALAEKMGKSRNFLVSQLMQLGFEEVTDLLPRKACNEVMKRASELCLEHLESAEGSVDE